MANGADEYHAVHLLQVSFAFGRIESALNYILNHLNELSGLAAQAERLDALLAGVSALASFEVCTCAAVSTQSSL